MQTRSSRPFTFFFFKLLLANEINYASGAVLHKDRDMTALEITSTHLKVDVKSYFCLFLVIGHKSISVIIGYVCLSRGSLMHKQAYIWPMIGKRINYIYICIYIYIYIYIYNPTNKIGNVTRTFSP